MLTEAVAGINEGRVILHPTSGVFGLAADPSHPDALECIHTIKKLGPNPRPFLVLALEKDLNTLCNLAALPPVNRRLLPTLLRKFWPGPLTLVMPASDAAPNAICSKTANHRTIAVRDEPHPIARELLEAVGRPLLSTSANHQAQTPPQNLTQVHPEIRAQCLLFDGGPPPSGHVSSIVDMTQYPPRLLREGGISKDQLSSLMALV